MNNEELKPYSLKIGNDSSEIYYQKLSEFTDNLLLYAHSQFGELLRKYTIFGKLHPNDALLDMLITGVLFNTYANQNQTNIRVKSEVLNLLYKLRSVSPNTKKITDKIRGKLAYNWLGNSKPEIKEYEIYSIDSLIQFLKGTSEYSEEIIRMQLVKKFLKSLSKLSQTSAISQIVKLAESFEKRASIKFHQYTSNVEHFWNSNRNKYVSRENYFFCSKKPVEYHLNMVGAELMNRTLKPIFKNTEEQVILVPTCMSSNPNCKKETINNELVCTSCNENCHVNRIKNQFNNTNIRTVLIPHSSKFSQYLRPWEGKTKTGLIGVACVLNLLKGGFEMKRLGIPSQCVFLDYSGCAKHWHSGIATNINQKKLSDIINQVKEQKSVLKIA